MSPVTGAPLNFLIPNHKKGSMWLLNFLGSIAVKATEAHSQVRVIILITNEEESIFFATIANLYSNNYLHIEQINIDDYLGGGLNFPIARRHMRTGARGAMAVFKKFVGLHWASENIDGYFLCFDADSICVNMDKLLMSQVIKNHDNGIYWGLKVRRDEGDQFYKILR